MATLEISPIFAGVQTEPSIKGIWPIEMAVCSGGSFEIWGWAINLLKILKKGFIRFKLSETVEHNRLICQEKSSKEDRGASLWDSRSAALEERSPRRT